MRKKTNYPVGKERLEQMVATSVWINKPMAWSLGQRIIGHHDGQVSLLQHDVRYEFGSVTDASAFLSQSMTTVVSLPDECGEQVAYLSRCGRFVGEVRRTTYSKRRPEDPFEAVLYLELSIPEKHSSELPLMIVNYDQRATPLICRMLQNPVTRKWLLHGVNGMGKQVMLQITELDQVGHSGLKFDLEVDSEDRG